MCVHLGIGSSGPQATEVSGDFCLCMYLNFDYSSMASVNVYIWGLRIEKAQKSSLCLFCNGILEIMVVLFSHVVLVFSLLHSVSILIRITEAC
jgi:hypothetical protein